VTSSATEVGGRRREEAGEGEFEVFRFKFEGGLGVPPRDLVGYGSGVGDDVRRRGWGRLKSSDSGLKEGRGVPPRDLVGYGSGVGDDVRRRGRERLKSSDSGLKEGEESRLVTSSATEAG